MQITEISKNGQNVKILVDGEFWAEIPYLIAFDFRLQKGMQVTKTLLQEVLQKTDEKHAFEYSVRYLSKYRATNKKMISKLYEKGYKKSVVDSVVGKLCELKYLDDFAYAESLVAKKSNKLGINRLKAELKRCGIENEIINEVLGGLDMEDSYNAALTVAKKWYRSHELEKPEDSQKFFRYMAYRGFDYGIINRCREVLKFGEDD